MAKLAYLICYVLTMAPLEQARPADSKLLAGQNQRRFGGSWTPVRWEIEREWRGGLRDVLTIYRGELERPDFGGEQR
jgi:hypothetical protein